MSFLGFLGANVGNFLNFGSQAFGFGRQMRLQREAWDREDTAIQRRVRDLRAAGLSPVLAAGQGAAASGPIRVTAPQMGQEPARAAREQEALVKQLLQQTADISRTQAQEGLLRAQADVQRASVPLTEARTAGQQIENRLAQAVQPARIEQELQQARAAGLDNSIRVLDQQIKEFGVSRADVAWARESLALAVAKKYSMSSAEQDLVGKQLAIEISRYNKALAERMKLPVGTALDWAGRFLARVPALDLAQSGLSALTETVRKTSLSGPPGMREFGEGWLEGMRIILRAMGIQ